MNPHKDGYLLKTGMDIFMIRKQYKFHVISCCLSSWYKESGP